MVSECQSGLAFRSTRHIVVCIAIALLSCINGCAAIKATQQPEKKDLRVLQSGTPRTHLIAELGPPLWSDERDGATIDVFTFKQGYSKPVKAGRALIHGAADVATLGLWEVVGIPVESIANGEDVQVEVTYDDRHLAKTVDVIRGDEVVNPRPWFNRKSKKSEAVLADQPSDTTRH